MEEAEEVAEAEVAVEVVKPGTRFYRLTIWVKLSRG